MYAYSPLSRKFKRVSLNETPEFPVCGVYICLDFNLRNQKTKREWKETTCNICHNKIFKTYKTVQPHSWNQVSDTGFYDDTLS